jgi:haloacetate dehalogenase
LVFEGFALDFIDVGPGKLRVRHGGSGPPVLLLHGHPRTHMTWGQVADMLAPNFTVICPDLRGFGQSFLPEDADDHVNSAKRAKANDCVALMRSLGHERFSAVGHDRGSYVAFRLAMDHGDALENVVVIDGVPIIEHLERTDWRFARDWYHWFFFAQPDKPERAISVDPLAWYGKLSPSLMGEDAYQDIVAAVSDPRVIHGMIEDYRAGLTVDRRDEMDARASGRKINCPLLCLWSTKDDLVDTVGDPLEIWRRWAKNVQGFGIESGHHVAEENPVDLAAAISRFIG